MIKILNKASYCALFVLLAATVAMPCGKKFLVKSGLAKKSQCYAIDSKGSILFFRSSESQVAQSALGDDVCRDLRGAGHTVKIVDNAQDFLAAVKNEEYDIIVADFKTTEYVEKSLKEAGKDAAILPVVAQENTADINAAKERYGVTIRDTDRTSTKVLFVSKVLEEGDKRLLLADKK